ncbi:MAG: type 4a pilus biogenesis protein PilO [Pseudomonadota bacterium]|nr:MAG: hypothetical protein DIU78_12050 [Pseudomonadota bacterium]
MARDVSLQRLPVPAKVGVAVGLLALVGIVYFVVFYGNVASDIEAAKVEEGRLRMELAEARKAEFAYEKDLSELTARKQQQRELNKMLPTDTEYPAFLSAVQNVANVSGVTLTAWSPSPEVPEQFYARVPMRLELTGRFHQIAKFFYGIGQLDRIINMENISLSQPKPVGEDVVVRVEGLATAFRAIENAPNKTGDKRGAAKKGKQ